MNGHLAEECLYKETVVGVRSSLLTTSTLVKERLRENKMARGRGAGHTITRMWSRN